MMKAAIYYGKNDIRIEERPIPEVGPDDVLLRNILAGICGTDINIVKAGIGNMGIRFGSEFGHEIVGEIVQVGSNVSRDIKVGMRVGINPITAKKGGKLLSCECGGFSQYIVIEEAALNYNLYEMADHISNELAVLIEPMSVGRHGAFSADPKPNDHIVVLGAGPIGLSAAAGLIAEGIENVCVVDIDAWRLEKAAELRAHTINTAEVSLEEGLVSHFGVIRNSYGAEIPNVNVFIDAAGAPPLFENVMRIAHEEARISVIAVYKSPVAVDLGLVMMNEIQIKGASGYTHEDITKVIDHISNQKTNIGSIITQVYKLDQIQEAFEKAIEAKGTIKVVVDLT
ncbi:Sorbitol dehydrogenase [compost metagenome]